jgi:mannose-1-phosphate guanylyltransferase/phosphomannomutase
MQVVSEVVGFRCLSKPYYQTKPERPLQLIILKAAILAGGAGTRLYPITAYVPKILLPVGNRYVIEYVIEYLKQHGITEIVMLLSESEFEVVRNQLGDGSRYSVRVEYSVAQRIGTAGAVQAAANLLGDQFVVYYGDVLTDMDLSAMIKFHESKGSICTLALSTSVPVEYGLARVDSESRVWYFEEKPVLKEYPISMGVDIMNSEVIAYCKRNTDIASDVIPRLLQDRKQVYGYLTQKRHYDIGTFKTLEEVRMRMEKSQRLF